MSTHSHPSTGLTGLDDVLKGLLPGDNVVWQVEDIADYAAFVRPYVERAKAAGQCVVYIRFAKHPPLFSHKDGVETFAVDPDSGFERFINEIHRLVERNGANGAYVFDCLSDLAADWYSDQMLANFFMLTCPYIYQIKAVAYFALFRNCHSSDATGPIADTTQILLDVFHHNSNLYISPYKVEFRHSPTMYMLHRYDDGEFKPVTGSVRVAEVMSSMPWSRLESASHRLDVWSRTIREAEELDEALRWGETVATGRAEKMFHHILRMLVSRDERVLKLAEKYLTMTDVLAISHRMVGTGLIGGKSVGMLLARAILRKSHPRWENLLETHDSFFIGSDVFYTFLVRNGCWWLREKQKDTTTFLEDIDQARKRIAQGKFPDYIVRSFSDMLDYFGQSPIIVRSSSLLEDNFGNAFSGKYDSVFCPNQGTPERRLEEFINAVRSVYASSMSEDALNYRADRGILDRDEQMALLVQRVSGSLHHSQYFPDVAGVGYSFNPYVWSRDIDPDAGMLRLVFGLGTRAVDRSDDDYTRIVALNAPDRRPESNFDQVRRYAQHRVDLLDLQANMFTSASFTDVAKDAPDLPLDLLAYRDDELERLARDRGMPDVFPYVLTFDGLFGQTPFVSDMRDLLQTLQRAYEYPVDVEFTANLQEDSSYRINVLQCRPFPVKGTSGATVPVTGVSRDQLILHTRGPVVGQSRVESIDRIVYVVPAAYAALPQRDQYSIARLVGKILRLERRPKSVMLVGPGRWGTSTPSLGVPVSFAEISSVTVLCEVVAMRDDLVPDVSLGTHFFNDLVEVGMLYVGYYPAHAESFLNQRLLDACPNRLPELLSSAADKASVIRVIEAADIAGDGTVRLYANALTQRVVCCIERVPGEGEVETTLDFTAVKRPA